MPKQWGLAVLPEKWDKGSSQWKGKCKQWLDQKVVRIRARASSQRQSPGHHPARPQGRGAFEAKPGSALGRSKTGHRHSCCTTVMQLAAGQRCSHSVTGEKEQPSHLPFFTTALPSRGPGQVDSNLASQAPRGAMRLQLSRGHRVLSHLP